MYAYYRKAKPIRVRITRSPGFHFVHAGNHTFACLDAPDTHRWTASVFFAAPNRFDKGIDFNALDILAPEEEPDRTEILMDQAFPCAHLHHVEKAAPFQTVKCAPVNPLWWSLADTAFTSTLTSTCGCH